MQNYKVDKKVFINHKFKNVRKSKKFIKVDKITSYNKNNLPYIYGLQVLENGYLYQEVLECIRIQLSRSSKKKIKFRACFLPDKPLTKKSKGARMGRGRGNFFTNIFKVKKGSVIISFSTVLNKYKTKRVLSAVISKIPFKCCIIYKKNCFWKSNWF